VAGCSAFELHACFVLRSDFEYASVVCDASIAVRIFGISMQKPILQTFRKPRVRKKRVKKQTARRMQRNLFALFAFGAFFKGLLLFFNLHAFVADDFQNGNLGAVALPLPILLEPQRRADGAVARGRKRHHLSGGFAKYPTDVV